MPISDAHVRQTRIPGGLRRFLGVADGGAMFRLT